MGGPGFVSRGSLFVQDESAGLVVSLLDPQPGDRLLDCCAAPGGKTLFAAARMRGVGSITALDVSSGRLRALRTAAEVAGVGGMALDLRDWAREVASKQSRRTGTYGGGGAQAERERERSGAEEEGGARRSLLYDKVLLDAPCTGTGVLAKRADLRWRRTTEQLWTLVALQDGLLEAAAGLVAPGGVLVYSTYGILTIEVEEDQWRVLAFLDRHPEFNVEAATGASAAVLVPGGPEAGGARGGGQEAGPGGRSPGPMVPASVVTAEGFMATLPHVNGTDGAFAARMRRRR
ncbi:Ribosomal RNA small subunit methyltransferase B [Tetrabaena socialis]|uniref:Ribosomal RNA small subunit methyltransferase B n=1 Tax=Tetrabaena socialis TaxID=47790 RepID=A0A2J8AHU6_9CHLO|nr:Ribosomal RNA small subunit methyltransferase B [Tetrabaena socialis]|eukprot:PNH12092.1 Ribosomal RNA small subunit methyltransferase B [Tetrabaena socialis]